MGDAEPVGDAAGVVDVLAGAAGAAPPDGLAVVVELQGDADDVVALLLEQRGDDRGVDAARHRHDDASRGGDATRRLPGGVCWTDWPWAQFRLTADNQETSSVAFPVGGRHYGGGGRHNQGECAGRPQAAGETAAAARAAAHSQQPVPDRHAAIELEPGSSAHRK